MQRFLQEHLLPQLAVSIFIIVIMSTGYMTFYAPLHSYKISPNKAASDGFEIAQQCFPSSKKLNDIQLNIVPGNGFSILFESDRLAGLAFFDRVYVSQNYIDDKWTWAHEFVHSFGVIGHPKNIFERCGL